MPMYYRNKDYHTVTTNTTTSSPFAIVLMTLILSSVTVVTISSILMHKVDAQMNNNSNSMAGSMMGNGNGNSSNMGSNMGSNIMAIPAKPPVLNISTAAPPITPSMFKSMASQIHVDLTNATMIAQKWVGSDSHAVSSMIGIQNGSPVYTIWVIDSSSGIHQIVVDPENGKVLFANQPMSMTGPFS